MSTLTTNYDFIKPAVNSAVDEDLWGDETNDNWDSLDTLLKAVSDVADAAAADIAALGTAAALNVGTGANQVVQLNGSAELPAVSGINLTNVLRVAASSLAANGYVKFSNTLTLQWFTTASLTGGGTTNTVSFPIAFTTAYAAFAMPYNTDQNGAQANMHTKNLTNTTIDIRNTGSATTYQVFAIGVI